MTIDTSREAVEQLIQDPIKVTIDRKTYTLDRPHNSKTVQVFAALLARAEAAEAEVARLSTPPDDAEVVELVERAREWWSSNQVGATDLLNTMANALTSQAHALAAERKLADDAKRLLEMAQDRCGHNFVGAEYPTFVDFCDAHEARRKAETLAKHGSK